MKDLTPADRPREKLLQAGVGALGDNELLAVLIGHGTRGVSALALANQVLATAGGLHGLTRTDHRQLSRVPGIGHGQAARVLAAIEFGRRTLLAGAPARPRFRQPRDVAQYLLPRYGAFPVERFGVVLLDTRCRLLSSRLISVGTLDASSAHPRDVLREALLAGAAQIVVFHNHPSGDVTPSRDDVALTLRLARAARTVGLDLLDHMILGDTQYCSMKESKVL